MERDGHTEEVLVDVESGSWAAVEEKLGRWHAVGTPALEEFTVTVTPQGQTISW